MPFLNGQLVYPEAEPAYGVYYQDQLFGNAVLWSVPASGLAQPLQAGYFPRLADLRVARKAFVLWHGLTWGGWSSCA